MNHRINIFLYAVQQARSCKHTFVWADSFGTDSGDAMKTLQECCSEIAAMSKSDLCTLKADARRLAGDEWEDVLQESILLTLTGERKWNDGVTFLVHLRGCIRSVAWNWRKKRARTVLECELGTPNRDGDLDEFAQPSNLDARLDDAAMLTSIETSFASDSRALQVISLLCEGWRGEAVGTILDLSPAEYAAVVKRIRRRLQKRFHEQLQHKKTRGKSSRAAASASGHSATIPCVPESTNENATADESIPDLLLRR
jgi:DNA-directed RNA polymerase specialized sigma24 family protein